MNILDQAKTLTSTAALATAFAMTPVQAEAHSISPVSIAIVDHGADRLSFDDPNVRFVDLTPRTHQAAPTEAGTAGLKHGDHMASAFVKQYRKLDAKSPIVIYSIDPFVEKSGDSPQINTALLERSISTLQNANVRIALTDINFTDADSASKFASTFGNADIALMTTVANNGQRFASHLAAQTDVMSVTTEDARESFRSTNQMAGWVDFVVANPTTNEKQDVPSLIMPKVGAYAAFLVKREPTIPTGEIRTAVASLGQKVDGQTSVTVQIQEGAMIARLRALPEPCATASYIRNRQSANAR